MTAVASILLAGFVLGLLWAVANPLVATGAIALAVGSGALVKRAYGRFDERRRTGRTREVCLDSLGVCVEV